MDDTERQQWAVQVEAVRERADVATRALFTIKSKLDEAAAEWARTANGFPVAQSLRILAADCNAAWHAAIDAHEARGDLVAESMTGARKSGFGIAKSAVGELSTTERNSLLRIIHGMASADPYRFDPTAKRQEATTLVASATDAAGCSVDPDTVRKWLRIAAEEHCR